MSDDSKERTKMTAGLDLGDRYSRICLLDTDSGEVVEESRLRTTPDDLCRRFGSDSRLTIALEVGTHSPWASRLLSEGDKMLRGMLVNSAHYILGPFSQDSDLKRHGQKIAERGGKNAKKRAVVAVARKLSVLLHHLWTSGEVYEPLRNARSSGTQEEEEEVA